MTSRLPLVRTVARVLTFRASREELLSLDHRFLIFGFVATWLVGMGRYWDSPRAELLQRLGVGSVLYVVALSVFLWLILWPLRPNHWSFRTLLTFITLVSPPAALYAIPVERFVSLETAQLMNAWFLAVVATWRVALLFFFLMRVAQLRWFEVIVGSLLPLGVIVTALALLNLEYVVFDLMSGIQSDQRSPNDTAYMVVLVLTLASLWASPALAAAFVVIAILRNLKVRRERTARAQPSAAAAPPAVTLPVIPPPEPAPSERELR